MTQEELVTLCAEWQDRLRLGHWDIAVTIARARDCGAGKAGHIDFNQRALTANIAVLDSVDYPPGPHKEDQEETLVHELLHLWFAPVQPDAEEHVYQDIMFENAINRVAEALVTLKYSKKEETNA